MKMSTMIVVSICLATHCFTLPEELAKEINTDVEIIEQTRTVIQDNHEGIQEVSQEKIQEGHAS